MRKAWAKLIRQVFEVDPLKCPQCEGELKILSFIEKDKRELINKILDQIDEERAPPDYNKKPRWFLIKEAQENMIDNWDYYCIDPVYEDEIA